MCVYVGLFVCLFVCLIVCVCVCHVNLRVVCCAIVCPWCFLFRGEKCMYVCMYVCTCGSLCSFACNCVVCLCVCMYFCVYVCVCGACKFACVCCSCVNLECRVPPSPPRHRPFLPCRRPFSYLSRKHTWSPCTRSTTLLFPVHASMDVVDCVGNIDPFDSRCAG